MPHHNVPVELEPRLKKLTAGQREILEAAANAHSRATSLYRPAMAEFAKLQTYVWQLQKIGVPVTTIALRLGVSRGQVQRWARTKERRREDKRREKENAKARARSSRGE